jgi:hypothetical protein
MSILTDLRDTIWTTIAVKQVANSFYTFNNFVLEKTWKPWEELENLFDAAQFPNGKLYIIPGRPGDMITISRNNLVQRDYPIHFGFQHKITGPLPGTTNDQTGEVQVDQCVAFLEEIEETIRTEIDQNLSQLAFNRLEPQRDPNGVPLSFVLIREANLFESYFTAFFTRPLAENVATTTTTT